MTLTFCSLCPDDDHRWAQHDPNGTKLAAHQQLRHGVAPLPAPVEPVTQLPNVAFQQAFADAVRALPIGWEGTTADLHAIVDPPADHHWWGSATTHVAHLGLLKQLHAQKSTLPTTNGSLVNRWVRVESSRRAS